MNDDDGTQFRGPTIGTQVFSIFIAMIVGVFVAIVTILFFEMLFRTNKEAMLVALVFAVILGSGYGLRLRRVALRSAKDTRVNQSD
ncbi:hypothetical protein [Stratiformator vulcanicus]|uniref:Uncharacterized protein n=1 Tax=Stratiformator vulcanicus TaxID=2527980 RepID=A0A517R440_9PLAN|nr:hypothetical protein [Stratiformator vulcanicus]QDT38617.1 hypothetical protein Pan189_30120 [Stratiformator vulcanicus]